MAAGLTRTALREQLVSLGYRLYDLLGHPVDASLDANDTSDAPLPERNLCGVLPGVAVRWNEPAAERQ